MNRLRDGKRSSIHMTEAIRTEHLGKSFKHNGIDVVAVRDFSLDMQAGELLGLFGHNGAGKSTLVRMLATLIRPTHGSAQVNGFDVVRDEQKVRASVGLAASDERSFYGQLNAWDNLRFYAALQNVPRQLIAERVRSVLDLLELSQIAKRPFQTYSTGQRQRLNLARALVHNPPILFLDEPTKSMDVQTSDSVRSLIKHELVGRQGKTVVFISHELHEIENFCDRVAIMHRGRLRALGTPSELIRQLPAQPSYRFEVECEAAAVVHALQQVTGVEGVNVIRREGALATLELRLVNSNGASDGIRQCEEQIWQAVYAGGGRIRSYQPVGNASLRDVVRYFSSEEL